MYYISIAVLIIVIAIWLHRARVAPYALYGYVYVFIALGIYALALLNRLDPYLTWSLPGTPQKMTTVFVAQTKTPLWVIIATATTLALPVLLWVQGLFGAMYYPSLTRWLIWPMLAGLVIVNATMMILIHLITLSPAADAVLTGVQSTVFLIGMMSVPALYFLALLSFLRRAGETKD